MDDAVPTGLEAVRARRAELRETIDNVERALAKPTGAREVVWGEAVHSALRMTPGRRSSTPTRSANGRRGCWAISSATVSAART